MSNGNANGTRQLARMELQFKNLSYEFTINPEVYDLKMQNKINLQYTKGGAFIDAFGEGIKELSIVGTTGFKGTDKDPEHGYNKFVELKRLIETNMNDVELGKEITEFLKFYNHTDGEAYVCVPIRMNLSRNVNQPLLYKYDIALYAIRRVGDPVPKANIQVIGNPLGTPKTKNETMKDRDKVEKKNEKDGTSRFSTFTYGDEKYTVYYDEFDEASYKKTDELADRIVGKVEMTVDHHKLVKDSKLNTPKYGFNVGTALGGYTKEAGPYRRIEVDKPDEKKEG